MNRFLDSAAFLSCAVLAFAPAVARARAYSLAASGTISFSTDEAIPVGTPWTFEVIYDTAAPDFDFEVTGSPTPTFGNFNNTGSPPALIFFHYQAADYEVTIDGAADFGAGSGILVTFSDIHAIDLNVSAPALFPPVGGGVPSFHADFNDFSQRPIFVSDALPTDPALGPDSFDVVTVSLLDSPDEVTGSTLTSFTVAAVPEPSALTLAVVGLVVPLLLGSRRASRSSGR